MNTFMLHRTWKIWEFFGNIIMLLPMWKWTIFFGKKIILHSMWKFSYMIFKKMFPHFHFQFPLFSTQSFLQKVFHVSMSICLNFKLVYEFPIFHFHFSEIWTFWRISISNGKWKKEIVEHTDFFWQQNEEWKMETPKNDAELTARKQ